jgi:hypothetical protein
MHGREFRNIETIRKDAIGFALEKMFAFVSSDMGNGCKYVASMCCSSLDAIAVINSSFTSLRIHIEVLEVVVEVDRSGAEIASKESCMRGEDSGNIDSASLAERERDAREPLVEMGNDSFILLVRDKLLCGVSEMNEHIVRYFAYLS